MFYNFVIDTYEIRSNTIFMNRLYIIPGVWFVCLWGVVSCLHAKKALSVTVFDQIQQAKKELALLDDPEIRRAKQCYIDALKKEWYMQRYKEGHDSYFRYLCNRYPNRMKVLFVLGTLLAGGVGFYKWKNSLQKGVIKPSKKALSSQEPRTPFSSPKQPTTKGKDSTALNETRATPLIPCNLLKKFEQVGSPSPVVQPLTPLEERDVCKQSFITLFSPVHDTKGYSKACKDFSNAFPRIAATQEGQSMIKRAEEVSRIYETEEQRKAVLEKLYEDIYKDFTVDTPVQNRGKESLDGKHTPPISTDPHVVWTC